MPRQAKLGKKNGYWFTRAGNPNGVYFGRTGVMSYEDVKRAYGAHLKSLKVTRHRQEAGLIVADLIEKFLDWIEVERSERTYGVGGEAQRRAALDLASSTPQRSVEPRAS